MSGESHGRTCCLVSRDLLALLRDFDNLLLDKFDQTVRQLGAHQPLLIVHVDPELGDQDFC